MSDREEPPRPAPRARGVDLVSLVAGVVVAVVWVAFAFGDLDSLGDQARVVWPTVLVAVGIGLLASSRRR